MSTVIIFVCGFLCARIMNTTGYGAHTWQWWAIVILMIVVYVTGAWIGWTK